MFINFKNHIYFYSLFLFVILVGCKLQEPLKTHGIIYLENRSQKLILNKTNKNDVVNIMGKPHIKERQNEQTWIYIERVLTKGRYHKLGQHVLKDSNVLVLDFDKFGVLEKKQFLNKDKINKIKFTEKNTENKLSQKSFVQKFLQSIQQKMYINKR